VPLVVALVVTAGVVVGYVVHRDHTSAGAAPLPTASGSPAPVPSSPAPRGAVLPALQASAPEPTSAGVTLQLAADAHQLQRSAHLAGEVIDADTGTALWAHSPGAPEPPASTTKLLTAAAALTALGPNDRLVTSTAASGHTLYLVGGGDPTIVANRHSVYSPVYPRPATLAALAHRTAAALGSVHRVHLKLDVSKWTGPRAAVGWKPSYVTEGDITPPSPLEVNEGRTDPSDEFAPRTPNPAEQAGQVFAGLLEHDGVRVVGAVTGGTAPAGTPELAHVDSPPVSALVQRMLTVSDDDLAEALGRAVAIEAGLPASFAGAAQAVLAQVRSLGVSVTSVTLHDTSGLSHRDRITPRTLVDLLRAATASTHRDLRWILEGLPVAGLTGTLADRYQVKPSVTARGIVRAKTGTLTGVNTLAGTVVDRSGRLLVFAFMASHAALPGLTVPDLDDLAARLARCGCGG